MRLTIIFLIITCIPVIYSQNITIKGKAHPSHIGKEIVLSDYTDYITYNKFVESRDTIDQDGYFELKIYSKRTKPILISIQNLIGKLYVQPDYVYGIYFPGPDSTMNHQAGIESEVNLSVFGRDSTELNALIMDFNTQYNVFFSKYSQVYLTPSKINLVLDSFLVYSSRRYKPIKNNYFKKYVEYSFAQFFSNTSRSKTILYKQFIDRRPILYDNFEYMEFFNIYFKGYLKAYASTKSGGSIFNSINTYGDYQDLKNQFKNDKSISNDTLKELLIIKGLMDFYYSPDFDKRQVQTVIEQFYRETQIREHKIIAQNILQQIYQLQPGAMAPDFTIENKDGKTVNLKDFKGRHIYLNFFSTQSETSLREMQKIIDLKKKFGNNITFVSVCLDDSIKTYKAYLKSNPKQDWIILFQSSLSNAKQAYNIKSLSGFFFISPQFQLIQSPAMTPSEGIEYKWNAMFKPKKRNTIPGIR